MPTVKEEDSKTECEATSVVSLPTVSEAHLPEVNAGIVCMIASVLEDQTADVYNAFSAVFGQSARTNAKTNAKQRLREQVVETN